MTSFLKLLAAVVVGLPLLSTDIASAQSSPPLCFQNSCPPKVNVDSNDDSLGVEVTKGVSDFVPGRGTPETHGDAPGRREWLTVEEYITPACAHNGFNGNDALCTFALVSCPADDQLRYWIWHTTTRHTRDEAGAVTDHEPVTEQLPGSYCLGPDDPGVPTIGRVIAEVQSGFRNLPLPKAGVQVDPAPTSLVHIPTAFFAGGEQTATFSPTILGTTVTINAKATQWQWTWGDGTSSTTDTPGVPKRPVVSHVYPQARDYQVSVATTWTGTFTLPGTGEVFQIRTPAVVQSPPVTVQVREARTQLVDQ